MRHLFILGAVCSLSLAGCAGLTKSVLGAINPIANIRAGVALSKKVDRIQEGFSSREEVVRILGKPHKINLNTLKRGTRKEALQYCSNGHNFHTIWLLNDKVVATSFKSSTAKEIFCVDEIPEIDWDDLPADIVRKLAGR